MGATILPAQKAQLPSSVLARGSQLINVLSVQPKTLAIQSVESLVFAVNESKGVQLKAVGSRHAVATEIQELSSTFAIGLQFQEVGFVHPKIVLIATVNEEE